MNVREGAPLPADAPTASPPATDPSKLRLGAIAEGSDGTRWVVSAAQPLGLPALGEGAAGPASSQPAGSEHRWVLFRGQHDWEDAWEVHDNGGRPFLVRVTPRLFAVYKQWDTMNMPQWFHLRNVHATHVAQMKKAAELGDEAQGVSSTQRQQRQQRQQYGEEEEDEEDEEEPEGARPAHDVLVLGPSCYQKVWSANDDKNPGFGDGHCVLVQLEGRDHVFIQDDIRRFQLSEGEAVEALRSYIGNSDVPYPAIVTNRNTYLTCERTFIPNELRDPKEPDPYGQLYSSSGNRPGHREWQRDHPWPTQVLVERCCMSVNDDWLGQPWLPALLERMGITLREEEVPARMRQARYWERRGRRLQRQREKREQQQREEREQRQRDEEREQQQLTAASGAVS